jgi:hypothetical protein
MATDVQAKTIEACAQAVHAASRSVWEEAEAAAGHDAAERLKAKGYPPEYQQNAAEGGRLLAAEKRAPLEWEVFARPGRWFGRWELALAFPDGRVGACGCKHPHQGDTLVVDPADTEQDIAGRLAALKENPTQRV